jgi:hypothetical protein
VGSRAEERKIIGAEESFNNKDLSAQRREQHGKGEISANETACKRRDDRSHRSWQDHVNSSDHSRIVEQGPGAVHGI